MKLLALSLVLFGSIAFGAKKATLSAPSSATPSSTKKPASSSSTSSTTLGKRLTADNSSKLATGLRVMLVIPAWEGVIDARANGVTQSGKSSASEAIGLFIGAADIPVQRAGWLGGGSLSRATLDKENYTLLRGEMNMTWGFTKQIYTKWGANLHKFTSAPIDLSANVGLQVGAGLQLNRTLGAELALVYMTQKGSKNGIDYDTRATGIELGVTGTF